jgi:hypothetical protein
MTPVQRVMYGGCKRLNHFSSRRVSDACEEGRREEVVLSAPSTFEALGRDTPFLRKLERVSKTRHTRNHPLLRFARRGKEDTRDS